MPNNNESGFSLIELSIILAIIGILVSIAGPNILQMAPRIQLSNAAQRIMTDLQFARMRSIATGKEYRLNFAVSTESYQIEEGAQSSGSNWPGKLIDKIRKFNDSSNLYYHKGIDIQSVNQNPIFTPKGFTTTTTIIKIQNDNGDNKKILVNIAGRIKISDE